MGALALDSLPMSCSISVFLSPWTRNASLALWWVSTQKIYPSHEQSASLVSLPEPVETNQPPATAFDAQVLHSPERTISDMLVRLVQVAHKAVV